METARRVLGPHALIGGTANSLDEALRVAATDVDYLGVGPVFGTRSKANPAPPLGLDGFRAIVRGAGEAGDRDRQRHGGSGGRLARGGAHGVAVISAVVCQADPAAAAREFRSAVDAWLGARVA